MYDFVPVILSGGSGTRLWPLSRASRPKQFIDLRGDRSLFDETLSRVSQLSETPGIVVSNDEHRFVVAERLRVADKEAWSILLEPCARNTAPAIAIAALRALELDPQATLFVAPADHLMTGGGALRDALAHGVELAREGRLVTFGIDPTRADTGYGYIRAADEDPSRVAEFVEKPDAATAQRFFDGGKHSWNSGMFLMGAALFLSELERFAPAMHTACVDAWSARTRDGAFTRLGKQAFFACPADSVDFAVMEKTSLASVATLSCDWSDLGSWQSVWEASERDEHDNATVGPVELVDAHRNYVRSEGKLVAVVGCDDLVVIDSGDAVLVARREATGEIKTLVESLKKAGRPEAEVHARVHRPWGNYEGIDRGERYQVKRIVVQPKEVLSLQKHYHRAEHWIVVRGVALVTCGEEQRLVHENESTYIPLGSVHRMENPGNIPLELIEVQSGSYLGEDDIVRLEDRYGRNREDRPGASDEAAPRKLEVVGPAA